MLTNIPTIFSADLYPKTTYVFVEIAITPNRYVMLQ